MRLAVPALFLAACGSSSPPPAKPDPVVEKKVTRVPIEDESKDEVPEEGVTFTKTKGAMAKEAIEAGLAPHTQELSDCYIKKVGKRRWLGGHIVLHWDIKADGTITSVKMAESDLGAWDIEKCLVEIAWAATFEKPAGGDADFTVPLEFSPTRSSQVWDEDKALRAVGGQLANLDECDHPDNDEKTKGGHKKKAPPKKDPDAKPVRPEPRPPSNVIVTLYVGPQGKAQSVGFSSPTSELGEKWTACAEQAAMNWRLPDPRGQIAKLAVRYRAE
ncbi:MAG TPA: AgmX/PglI C-terminal domain-containing protein [Kofleriaceae bacterium]|nr:AgmX/PglI C-terminal domain-containing protein [Kofleriaceae bacterium]